MVVAWGNRGAWKAGPHREDAKAAKKGGRSYGATVTSSDA